MVAKGDRVVVESEKVGNVSRTGVVTDVDGPIVRVQWDGGNQTSFIPSAGSMAVLPGRAPAPNRGTPRG